MPPVPLSHAEAHAHADSLYPPDLWDQSERQLQTLNSLFLDLAHFHSASLLGSRNGKHPIPARCLRRDTDGGVQRLILFREYPDPSAAPDSPDYCLGILFGEPPESMHVAGKYPAAAVSPSNPDLCMDITAAANQAFMQSSPNTGDSVV